jgi:hypothetical protein
VGRTKKEINWDVVEKKMEAGCSAEEIYECMCHKDTFYDRFKEHFGVNFSDYSSKARSVGLGNIRAMQYAKACQGNTHMLQFLGRELLGQGKDQVMNSPLDDVIAMRHENMRLLAELDKLRGING